MTRKISLKKGRTPYGDAVKMTVLEAMACMGVGTVEGVQKFIHERAERKFSWSTINKYLRDLVSEEKIGYHTSKTPSKKSYKKARAYFFYGDTFKEALRTHAGFIKSTRKPQL